MSANTAPRDAFILSSARTPMGSFNGALANVPATKLGAAAIRGAIQRLATQPEAGMEFAAAVDQCVMGNVLSAGLGQAPARQAALGAGLGVGVASTTVNKVCASGLKAVAMVAVDIMMGASDMAVAGGFENMSAAPYYLPRAGLKFGPGTCVDGMQFDGLTDPRSNVAMGTFAEKCAADYGITREQQDAYAIDSYDRAQRATENGTFAREIVPVEVPSSKRGAPPSVVDRDEECGKLVREKVPKLRPVFVTDGQGTVTAANASPISDGAAAIVVASGEMTAELGLKPVARIVAFSDAEKSPDEFTTAPSKAIPKVLKRAGLAIGDIDCFEINEAFAVVALANAQLLGIARERMNVHGGAVAMGHPLGCSGARILVSLLNVLESRKGRYGVAAICNGGGGSTAMVVERLTST